MMVRTSKVSFVFENTIISGLFFISLIIHPSSCPRTPEDWKTVSYFWPDQPTLDRLHIHLVCYWVYSVHDDPLTPTNSDLDLRFLSLFKVVFGQSSFFQQIPTAFEATTMSELKRASPPPKGRFYRRARALLIGLASLYALAVLLVMTPLIQTQFRDIPFLFPYRGCLRLLFFLPSF
jgi:hypothetical protein